jgi:putative hemolysin
MVGSAADPHPNNPRSTPPVSDVWLSIVMVVVFVMIGGVFAGAEIALVSLRESQVRAMADTGRRGQAVQKLLSDPNQFLAAVQVGVTFAGFFSAAFGASTLSEPFAEWLRERGVSEGLAGTVALVLVTIAISYLSLVVGELTPKRLALQRAEGFALLVAAPLNAIAKLSRPIIWLLSKSTNVLVRLFGGDPKQSGEAISQEELRDLVAAHESLSSDERRLIDEVFRAGEREVREVMTPRTEVKFLEASMTASRAARLVADSNWSRFPVVGRDEDDVVGFVHVRDLFLPNHPAGRAATVGDLAREVKRLPGTAGVLKALSEMRRENQHLAIVVDEYGGTDGIVTLEDLIEEVIGEIYDEYDEEVAPEGRQPPGGPREVDGLLNLDDFAEVTGLKLPDGPYETVAGYVLAELGRLPGVGDTIEAEGRTVEVLELDGRRISRLLVGPAPTETDDTADAGGSAETGDHRTGAAAT